jgi:hypothetical protein
VNDAMMDFDAAQALMFFVATPITPPANFANLDLAKIVANRFKRPFLSASPLKVADVLQNTAISLYFLHLTVWPKAANRLN